MTLKKKKRWVAWWLKGLGSKVRLPGLIPDLFYVSWRNSEKFSPHLYVDIMLPLHPELVLSILYILAYLILSITLWGSYWYHIHFLNACTPRVHITCPKWWRGGLYTTPKYAVWA